MEGQLPIAPFPAPPPLWKHFTNENVQRAANREPNKPVPPGLRCLYPPPPPPATAESYNTFGISQSLQLTLAPPPTDVALFDANSPDFHPARVLRQLTRSLLLNFLELITILGNNPEGYEKKSEHITRLMYNIHYAINIYRPHQAREGIKDMLEQRLEDGRREIQRCEQAKEKIEAFLSSVEQTKQEGMEISSKNDGHADKKQNEIRRMWDIIHNIDGPG